jgi:hypothetical protein
MVLWHRKLLPKLCTPEHCHNAASIYTMHYCRIANWIRWRWCGLCIILRLAPVHPGPCEKREWSGLNSSFRIRLRHNGQSPGLLLAGSVSSVFCSPHVSCRVSNGHSNFCLLKDALPNRLFQIEGQTHNLGRRSKCR